MGLWATKDQKESKLIGPEGTRTRNIILTQKLSKGDILFFQKKKALIGRETNLLVNH
eukprot:COSAG02_NODE_44271_length_367_cov_1.820896_1_plen_57_part_00